jgi:hypothetical protein
MRANAATRKHVVGSGRVAAVARISFLGGEAGSQSPSHFHELSVAGNSSNNRCASSSTFLGLIRGRLANLDTLSSKPRSSNEVC